MIINSYLDFSLNLTVSGSMDEGTKSAAPVAFLISGILGRRSRPNDEARWPT